MNPFFTTYRYIPFDKIAETDYEPAMLKGIEEEDRIPLDRPFFSKYENVRAGIKMLVISGCGEETVSWGDSVNGGVLTCAMKKNFNKCLTYREWWNKFRAESTFKKVKQVPICTNIGGFDVNAKIFN
jgi:hypothetical protein